MCHDAPALGTVLCRSHLEKAFYGKPQLLRFACTTLSPIHFRSYCKDFAFNAASKHVGASRMQYRSLRALLSHYAEARLVEGAIKGEQWALDEVAQFAASQGEIIVRVTGQEIVKELLARLLDRGVDQDILEGVMGEVEALYYGKSNPFDEQIEPI